MGKSGHLSTDLKLLKVNKSAVSEVSVKQNYTSGNGEMGLVGERRRCEESMVKLTEPQDFNVLEYGFPMWALALSVGWARSLTVLSAQSLEEYLHCNQIVYDLLLHKSKTIRFDFSKLNSLKDNTFLLVSGSLTQVCDAAMQCKYRVFFVVNSPWRTRRLPRKTSLHWMRLNSKDFGGAVDYNTLLGYRGVEGVRPDTVLRRTIKHHIDHGIRPQVWQWNLEGDYYKPEHLLIPSKLDKEVVYPTHFSATGWGIRPLSAREIACCFGLQTWTPQVPPPPFHPLQILCSQLSRLVLKSGTLAPPLLSVEKLAPPSGPKNYYWFPLGGSYDSTGRWVSDPSVGRYLSSTWLRVNIKVDTAAKADDAAIPKSLWNSRCYLLFPRHTPESLENLRLLIHGGLVRRLYLELVEFMRRVFGANWSSELFSIRAAKLEQGGRSVIDGDDDGLRREDEGQA